MQVLNKKTCNNHANPVVHPSFGRELSHTRINHGKSSGALLPTLKFLVRGFAFVVTHARKPWHVVVVDCMWVSEKDIGIELSPSYFFAKYVVTSCVSEIC
jgi:hypothetical protein